MTASVRWTSSCDSKFHVGHSSMTNAHRHVWAEMAYNWHCSFATWLQTQSLPLLRAKRLQSYKLPSLKSLSFDNLSSYACNLQLRHWNKRFVSGRFDGGASAHWCELSSEQPLLISHGAMGRTTKQLLRKAFKAAKKAGLPQTSICHVVDGVTSLWQAARVRGFWNPLAVSEAMFFSERDAKSYPLNFSESWRSGSCWLHVECLDREFPKSIFSRAVSPRVCCGLLCKFVSKTILWKFCPVLREGRFPFHERPAGWSAHSNCQDTTCFRGSEVVANLPGCQERRVDPEAQRGHCDSEPFFSATVLFVDL